MKISEQITSAVAMLKDLPRANSSASRLEVELLLAKVLQVTRSFLYAHPEQGLTPAQQEIFATLLNRRLAGEPLAYLLGKRDFWSLELQVDQRVLIPRPETEILVEYALQQLPLNNVSVLDLGTGSGAIALALAYERPSWVIAAIDRSTPALSVARNNAAHLELSNINFYCGDWYELKAGQQLQQQFTAIISNPPYIAEQDPHLMNADLQYEPWEALCGGADGLRDLQAIIDGAPSFLMPAGWIMLEHGMDQGSAVTQMLQVAGFGEITTINDLENRPRVTVGRKNREKK